LRAFSFEFSPDGRKGAGPFRRHRNRAKRLARELFRTDEVAFPVGWEVVLVIRSGMVKRSLAELRKVYAAAAVRILASKAGPAA
jgi:RNase P protein component